VRQFLKEHGFFIGMAAKQYFVVEPKNEGFSAVCGWR